MFNATDFTYDGVHSSAYNLLIASFDESNVTNTSVFAPNVKTFRMPRKHKFYFAGVEYPEPPEFDFSIITEDVLPDVLRREILTWLTGRNGFKKLEIHQPELEDYYYRCIFTAVDMIYVNGMCHGFHLTTQFDSPFCYGRPRKLKVSDNGEGKSVRLINDSDIPDGYVYPIVTAYSGFEPTDFEILNKTDSLYRVFKYSGLELNSWLEIDNELQTVKGREPGHFLSNFNKNWLKLRKGVNELVVKINGRMTIECPTYVLIGF